MAMQSGDFMNPANVLFTKSTIPETFSDTNIAINHVLARLTFNPKLVNTLPMLEVVQDEQGRWRSENNRYLYAFRVLRIRGLVEKVQVKVINKQLEKCEYASNRDGCHVTMVNNPNIFPHCSCEYDRFKFTKAENLCYINPKSQSKPDTLLNETETFKQKEKII